MSSVLKLLAGVALAMLFTLTPNTHMSAGDAWAAQTKKGCECLKFCQMAQSNKCVACREKCR
jgi:hypothetical protein